MEGKPMNGNAMSPRHRPKSRIRVVHFPDRRIVVMLPDGKGRLLKIMARSLLIIMAIVAFPWIRSTVGFIDDSNDGGNKHLHHHDVGSMDDYFFLPDLLRELYNGGLIGSGSRGVLIGEVGVSILEDMEMDLVVHDLESDFQSSIPNDSLDFVFAGSELSVGGFAERALKIGGILAVRLNEDTSDDVLVPPNYKIVYVHHYDATIVAMQKTGRAATQLPSKRSLCRDVVDARKAALSGLEDVLLEPPHLNSLELDQYVERTKYLPDLMGDSLDRYSRRVFVNFGLSSSVGRWFQQHYPTRSQVFEMYNVGQEMDGICMSGWLERNVTEEEYVVVKAEADVVEEMVKSEAICLVDELFLECNHQGQSRSKVFLGGKAYWECLSLLGRLRNEGIAVHQWWG